jgi:hypothetical protein
LKGKHGMRVIIFCLALLPGCVQTTGGTTQLTPAQQAVLTTGYTAGCRQGNCRQGSQARAQAGTKGDSLVVQTWSSSGEPPPTGLFGNQHRTERSYVIIERERRNSRVHNGARQIRAPWGGWCYSYINSDGKEVCS